MNKTTALKLIDQGEDKGARRHWTYVASIEGRAWASNAHWMAPAEWFAVVLGDYPAEGVYDAKAGEKIDRDCPDLARLFPTEEAHLIEPVRMHGSPIILQRYPHDLALFASEDGAETAFDRRYVDMFRDEVASAHHRHELAYRQETPNKPAYVYRSSSYTRVHGPEATSWSLCGIVMPVRLG